MTDEDIDTSDIPPLSDKFFSEAKLRLPISSQSTVAVNVDPETLKWFQNQGATAEKHITAALRIYAEAHKHADIPSQSA